MAKLETHSFLQNHLFFGFQCSVLFKIFTNQGHTLFQLNYDGHVMRVFHYLMFHRNRAVVLRLHTNPAIPGESS